MLGTMEFVNTYLDALAAADTEKILSLFADDAVVVSPLYGELPAAEFYPALFADSASAKLTLRSVMRGETATGTPTVAFWFDFDWVLRDGAAAPFEVVDIAELDASGRISRLHIIYDTVTVRPAFDKATVR
tara:strand:- start:5929 stop:6321 length:393 start_codon:yes stop_codon:yes gene_type:complete